MERAFAVKPLCTPRLLHRTCVWLGLVGALLALAGAAAQAAVSDYQLERLAFEGDVSPEGGTLVTIFHETDIDDVGRVAFWANVDGNITLFSVAGGVLSVEVATGDVAPGTGGSLLTDVGRARIATPGVLAYVGAYTGVIGGFLKSGAAGSALALPGDAAPGGGTISLVGNMHTIAPGPWVAFGGLVDPGGLAAHFVKGPGALREVYREGQAAPAAVGGSFTGVQPFWEGGVTPDGALTFGAAVAGGSATSGVFRSSNTGVITALLLEGDGVTTPGGGTFTGFARSVGVNAAGDAGFAADVLRAPAAFSQEAIFVLEGGSQREIVFRGDAIPGTSPARFFQGLSGSSPPELSSFGTVAFTASIGDVGETIVERAVIVDDGGDLGVLVKQGDPVPGVPGAVFTDFNEARVDASGRIAINAFTSLGAGVFLATQPRQLPALPPAGALLLVAALLGPFVARIGRVHARQYGQRKREGTRCSLGGKTPEMGSERSMR